MSLVESNTKLLKLHLHWPDRNIHNKSDQEALEFFKWLFLNYYGHPEMELLQDVEDVQEFLDKNVNVLRAKPAKERIVNLRIEPRIGNDVQTCISVKACEVNDEIVGLELIGRTLDLSLHGMRVSVDILLPGGSQLNMQVETEGGDTYFLAGASMWTCSSEDRHLAGISIFETTGFDAWRDNFGVNFVAPRIGRNYMPSL